METKFKFLRNKGGKNLTKIKENTRKLKTKFCLIRKNISNLFFVVENIVKYKNLIKEKKNLFLSSKSYDKNVPVYWTIETQS
jgi:hypothetical protein